MLDDLDRIKEQLDRQGWEEVTSITCIECGRTEPIAYDDTDENIASHHGWTADLIQFIDGTYLIDTTTAICNKCNGELN